MILDALNWRYATKRMNGRKVPSDKVRRILEAARLAPSAFGLQPYSILVIEDAELRARVRPIADDQPQITESSHLLVFAVWNPIPEARVDEFIELTAAERAVPVAVLEEFRESILRTLRGLESLEEQLHWARRQAYISLGIALVTAAVERVDATPMEGFDPAALDELLGLGERGLRSVALLALGYRDSGTDWLAGMKKVRWQHDRLIIDVGGNRTAGSSASR